MNSLARIIRSASALWPYYLGVVLVSTAAAALALVSPFIFREATDTIVSTLSGETTAEQVTRTLLFLAIGLLSTAAAWIFVRMLNAPLKRLVFAARQVGRGRSVRLMTVSVRPGKPNSAASSFLSGMVREPLAGERATCSVPPDTKVALSSPARTVEGLVRALETSDADWGPRTAMNLPAVATTAGEMAAALARVAGDEVAARIDWVPDDAITRIIASWPAAMNARRAARLGLHADASYDDIIRAHLRENPAGTGHSPSP